MRWLFLLAVACGPAPHEDCSPEALCPGAQSVSFAGEMLVCKACAEATVQADLSRLAEYGQTCADVLSLYEAMAAKCPNPCTTCR